MYIKAKTSCHHTRILKSQFNWCLGKRILHGDWNLVITTRRHPVPKLLTPKCCHIHMQTLVYREWPDNVSLGGEELSARSVSEDISPLMYSSDSSLLSADASVSLKEGHRNVRQHHMHIKHKKCRGNWLALLKTDKRLAHIEMQSCSTQTTSLLGLLLQCLFREGIFWNFKY